MMPGGVDDSSRNNKKKSMVVVSDMDGVTRAAATSNSARGASNRGGGEDDRGGGRRRGGEEKRSHHKKPLRDIEGEPRYTGREMRLTAAVAILTIVLFGLAAFIAVSGPLTGLLKPRCLDERLGFAGLCDSMECIDISYRSVHSANFSTDPCQDFYHFACSKWQTKNPISEEQLYLAANINQLRDSVDSFLKTLLEQETPTHKLDPGVAAVKNFYKSCINFTNPDENELILDLLDSLGGYKTTDLWSESNFDLTEVILKFLQVNAAPLIDLTLDIDVKNRERYALIVELPRQTSLVPNLFRPPRQDDDLMNSEYAYHNLIEEDEPISPAEMTPGLLKNATSQSSSTRTSSSSNSSGSSSNGSGDSNNGTSANSSSGNTVERQALYKMIKDSIDAKKREHLKTLVRKVGQLIRMSEAEILSDSQDMALIASNIEKIKPSQRSRKFWKQQNKVYNAYTLDQLQHQFGTVNWSFLFGELMGFDDVTSRENEDDYYSSGSKPAGVGASVGGSTSSKSNSSNKKSTINWHNSTIYVPYPDYLRRVLQMTQYTSKRMLYNTMLMMYVKDMLHDLIPRSQVKRDEQQQSHHHQKGRNQQHSRNQHHHHHQQQQQQEQQQEQREQPHYQQPRWKFCVQSTKSVFAMELSSMYMKSFKPSHLKRNAHDVEEIFANVKETLISFLNRSSELSSSSEDPQYDVHHQLQKHPDKYGKEKNALNDAKDNSSHIDGNRNPITRTIRSTDRIKTSGGEHHDVNISNGNGNSSSKSSRGNATSNNSTITNGDTATHDGVGVGGGGGTGTGNRIKDEAIRKIATLKGNFLGPAFYLQEDFLDDAIKNIRMDPNNFLFNVKVVYRTFREQLYNLYWKPVDEERATWAFVTFPTTVNAYYISQFNSIVIPLAFLNPPHYVEKAPVYINYATIALTIGHEAIHALDGAGSGFNADGRLQDWWASDPKAFLQKKTTCVAKQYSDNFRKVLPFYQTHHVPIQVDGNLTQNENLADIAGLQVAFSAYRKYRLAASKEDLKAERRIPGLVLTLEQAYFLTVAQAYCANISPMGYIFLLEMDEHTPHPERINGMLMNNPDFVEAYSCRAGTPMNPPLKCAVW